MSTITRPCTIVVVSLTRPCTIVVVRTDTSLYYYILYVLLYIHCLRGGGTQHVWPGSSELTRPAGQVQGNTAFVTRGKGSLCIAHYLHHAGAER
jgi:hypothetical protein